ncbi:MAG: hypothetical protein LBV17_11880, partial [Treponema sp.]|nr:hypothetical protein [Treponema sp.]
MKNKKNLLAALALTLALVMTACSNGSTGGGGGGKPVPKTDTYTGKTADGVEYTLKITQKTARFAILEGDI